MIGSGDDLSGFSMLELFAAEVETHGQVLSHGLLQLESDAAAAVDLEPLMRAAHSLKGAARIVDLEEVVQLAHAMEDCFVVLQERRLQLHSDHVDLLLAGLDQITRIAGLPEAEIAAWLAEHAAEISAQVAAIAALSEQPATPSDSDSRAQASAATVDSGGELGGLSMLELFRDEVEGQAAVLSEGLLAIEGSPGATELIESLMRAAHSIKGAARIVDLEEVVRLAHAMEDCFVAAQEGLIGLTSSHIDQLLAAVDTLREISRLGDTALAHWLAEHRAALDELLAGLAALSTAGAAAAAPAAAPGRVGTAIPAAAASSGRREPGAELRSRDLRISAGSLTQLMGLAGESVVAAGWLEQYSASLRQLKQSQAELAHQLEELRVAVAGSPESDGGLSELARAVVDRAGDCRQQLTDRLSEIDTFSLRSANLSNRLYRQVLSSRMRPFADGVQGFPRLVRDLARSVGKKVRLQLLGDQTEVDRDILERLEAPLNHLLRNAVDHGIELPEERRSAGKPEVGSITLEARHHAGSLLVTITDDGRGIDEEALRQRVVERELSRPEVVAQMSPAELMEFLFLPGFSTAAAVTEISGRGVGLDVVQSMVQEVGGVLRAESELGHGVTFFLQLPVTRSVIRTLLVEVSGEPLAFPLEGIDHTLLVGSDDIEVLEDKQYFWFDGQSIGLVSASQVLELPPAEEGNGSLAVVVISDQLSRFGVVVDCFVGERDVVVHPLDERLGKIADISAAALMEDGSPVLIVDVRDMVRSVDSILSGGRLRKIAAGGATGQGPRRKRLLVIDDSLTVREVVRQLFENAGYAVETAVDGMDGWNAVRGGEYDLVITDIDMPRMTGIELLEQIKGDAELASLPVMIVSYKDRKEDRLRGLEAGADYYLTKSSFHDDTMLEAVVDLIGRAGE